MTERKEAIVVMAKAPLAGQVKTRLIGGALVGLPAPLNAEDAAELAAAFLSDTFAMLEELTDARDGLRLVLCYTPADALEAFEKVEREGCLMLAQRGASLGERLSNCFADLFALGYEAVVIIGGDSPALRAEVLETALDELRAPQTIVCVPTEDGGYALLGATQLHEVLFADIEWSGARVFVQTRARAQAAQLAWRELPATYDLDTPQDVARWQTALGQTPELGFYTRRALKAIAKRMREAVAATPSTATPPA